MRHHAQLDLRVIRCHNQPVGITSYKRAPDPLTFVRADRDVLQIRVCTAQTAGGSDCLVESSVYSASSSRD